METEHANLNSQNSSSVLRKPGHPEDFVRGSTSNHPFRPGGFDLPQSSGKTVPLGALNGDWLREVLHGGPLQKVAPGFKHGIDFGLPEVSDLILSVDPCTNSGRAPPSLLDIREIIVHLWRLLCYRTRV